MPSLLLRHWWSRILLAGLIVSELAAARQLHDDREITIHRAEDVAARRAVLIEYLWGAEGFPRERLPDAVRREIKSPVDHLTALARVDELRIDLAPGMQGIAYHFIPKQPNGDLVIVHHGHDCQLNDDPSPEEVGHGLQRTIAGLLREGYGVLGVFMPRHTPEDCTGQHGRMFAIKTTGSPIKFFLEPTAVSLNYLKTRATADTFPAYREFHMVGLSGGGWTTTVYAAIDPAIKASISVAGTMPLYLRFKGSIGDREQFEPTFYRLAGYPDLYILCAYGAGRRHVQVVIRRDQCCFGEQQHDVERTGMGYAEALQSYTDQVTAVMRDLDSGSFTLQIDEVAPYHMISHYVIRSVILPTLRATR